ncbi:MAG TPA: hypothetical protein EYP33_07785 [Pyrodictium sp.]|nr:hypothetical protein [Pyrodictium sp.]
MPWRWGRGRGWSRGGWWRGRGWGRGWAWWLQSQQTSESKQSPLPSATPPALPATMGPWPGRGPWSHLPPRERPGWLLGRGWCRWLYWWSRLRDKEKKKD